MTSYVVVSSILRGKIDPPEPVSADAQAILTKQDQIVEAMAANQVHWEPGYNRIPRRVVYGERRRA